MLAVVVDDYDMGITHIIRGVDHLTNAARQTAIYKAMDWLLPVFAHVPLIHGADGAKLSKRHGALGVESYRDMGYLPDALRNYLVRLGWSYGDEELFSTQAMIEHFDFGGLGKSPARFDFAKLADINAHYMRAAPDEELVNGVQIVLKASEEGADKAAKFAEIGWDKFSTALPVLKERATTLAELAEAADFLIASRPIALDSKAAKILNEEICRHLANLADQLTELDDWTASSIEQAIREFIKAEGLKLGKIGPGIRAALTGATASPPIFDVLALLGRDEALGRIRDHCA